MTPLARRRRLPTVLAVPLAFAPLALAVAQDAVSLPANTDAYAGATVEIPVYLRDLAATPLGVDQGAGARIQGLSFKVVFAPAAAITSKALSRAGVTAGLAPTIEAAPSTATTASYIGWFAEATDPILFTLDALPPGDQVLKLTLTFAADAPAGTIALDFDAATTELWNDAGTLSETAGNGALALAGGGIQVHSNAALALHGFATSNGSIELSWSDPTANETGFRLERSTDGASWAPVASLGPDDIGYLDATGLAPATLYFYRLVTLIPADSHVSNVAAAATFPAVAAKVCPQAVATPPRSWTLSPSVAWDGAAWGVAWLGREGAVASEIWFQRFDAESLAAIGSATRVSAAAGGADGLRQLAPTLASNGAGYGLIWTAGLPGEPGTPLAHTTFFARLDASGNLLRNGVRLSSTTDTHPFEDGLPPPLVWDGTHWGFFELSYVTEPMLDLVYRRLDGDGDLVLGPITVLAPAAAHVSDFDVAWNAIGGKYGLFWHEIRDDDVAIYFQVLEETTGVLEGSATLLDDYVSVVGTYGGSVVADGDGWAVAWTDLEVDPELGEIGVSWMRRFDATGAPRGPATRLSDDPVADGGIPLLARKPAGGFAAFVDCGIGPREVCRLEADAAGVRVGPVTAVTPADGFNSVAHDVAGNGTDFGVVFAERGSGTFELGGSLVPVGDGSTPGPVTPLTAGHEATNAAPGNANVVPVGAGFAAVWVDPTVGSNRIDARIWDGAGALVASLAPLTPTPAAGRPVVLGVGDQFAIAFQGAATVDRWFARFDATGAPLVGETSISTLGNSNGIAMDFTGENYGLLWRRPGGFNFVLVAPDGTVLVADLLVPVPGVANAAPQMRWTGGGFAIVWRGGDNALHYTFLAPDGTPVVLDAELTTPTQTVLAPAFDLVWTGLDLGLAWSELLSLDPPLEDVRFVRLGLDGTLAFPPVVAVATSRRDRSPMLYWTAADSRFHLLSASSGVAGTREVELQADGTVLPGERWWSNRLLGAAAWNGATLGFLIAADGNLWFETGECVTADSSAPPCPALTVGSFDEIVRLDWDGVVDPQSGVFRYHVERDGLPLGATDALTTQFDDAGFGIGTTHLYRVRALSGAWNESDACPAVSFSTTAGDANGSGTYSVADIFYLINFFYSDGPPPAGNADANGDNGVSVGDVFYMINDLFGDGPPPVLRGEVVAGPGSPVTAGGVESAKLPGAGGAGAKSWLGVGRGSAAPGHTLRIPIDLYDAPGTPLGAERPFGERIQALALHVRCAPCDDVAALAVEPAGALTTVTPAFQSRPSGPTSAALIAAYDEAGAPLFAAAGAGGERRQRIGWVVVRIAEAATLGASFEIRLDPGTTTLANGAGTVEETAANGWLRLSDGRVTVGAPPRVAWR